MSVTMLAGDGHLSATPIRTETPTARSSALKSGRLDADSTDNHDRDWRERALRIVDLAAPHSVLVSLYASSAASMS